MYVCLINDSFPPVIDGVANVVLNYARILTESKKAGVVVGTPRYPDAEYDIYPYKVIPYQSIDTTQIVKGYRAGNPFDKKAIDAMADFRPDIIHTHSPVTSAIMARILRAETDAPVVFTYHTKFDVDIARAFKLEFLQNESAKALTDNISACDEVWTVSRGAGENLRSLGYEGEYRVVSNGVDFKKGRVDEKAVAKATAGFDLPIGLPLFLFVGRIMKYKGLPLIIDALKLLSEDGVDFRMVFIGDGADLNEMQKKAVENGFSVDIKSSNGNIIQLEKSEKPGKIIFAGAEHDRDVLRAWNTRADLFLFPSTYDTNGIVVREAAACGLASVLIKDSCAAEGITDGRNGFLIDETAASMAQLLKGTGCDHDKMHEAGQHAMDEIYISWDDAVSDAYSRYQELIDLKKSGKLVSGRKEPFDYLAKVFAKVDEGVKKIESTLEEAYEINGMV